MIAVPGMALMMLFVVCGGGVLWGQFVENRCPRLVQRGLFAVLAVTTSFELALCALSVLGWWMLPVILVTNTWGFMDAVLRFPVLHDFGTAFALKQILLLLLKVACAVYSLADFQDHWVWRYLVVLMNLFVLPMFYFLALPLEGAPKEYRLAASQVEDVDIAVRSLRLVYNRDARNGLVLACRRRWHKVTLDVAAGSKLTSRVLKGVSPGLERELRVRSL